MTIAGAQQLGTGPSRYTQRNTIGFPSGGRFAPTLGCGCLVVQSLRALTPIIHCLPCGVAALLDHDQRAKRMDPRARLHEEEPTSRSVDTSRPPTTGCLVGPTVPPTPSLVGLPGLPHLPWSVLPLRSSPSSLACSLPASRYAHLAARSVRCASLRFLPSPSRAA